MQTVVFEQSEQIGELAAALSLAQGAFPVLEKEKEVDTGKYTFFYADLVTVTNAVKEILRDNGLSYTQLPGWDDLNSTHLITTQVMHTSGQWVRSTMKLPSPNDQPQVLGSAITYVRRYALCAALGLVADTDDDGRLAQDAAEQSGSRRSRAPSSSTSTKGTKTGGSKSKGDAWDSRERNRVIAALGKAGVRGDEAVKAKIQEMLGLPEPTAPAQLTSTQGAALAEAMGVAPAAAPEGDEQDGEA